MTLAALREPSPGIGRRGGGLPERVVLIDPCSSMAQDARPREDALHFVGQVQVGRCHVVFFLRVDAFAGFAARRVSMA